MIVTVQLIQNKYILPYDVLEWKYLLFYVLPLVKFYTKKNVI